MTNKMTNKMTKEVINEVTMKNEKEEVSQNKLASMPVGRLLFSLAAPAIAAQIVHLLYSVVDRIYIGHIPEEGSLALSGIGLTFPVIVLISAFAALIGYGGAPRASIAMGKGDRETAEKILGNCITSLVATAVILTVIFYIFAEPVLYAFGASKETITYALPYLRIYVLGTLFVQITSGMNSFITAQGFSGTAMNTVMIGAGLNMVLDPVFIFGLDMGVQGAAVATVLSQAVSAVWVLMFLKGRKTILRIRKENLGINLKIMGSVLALGASPFIMQSTEGLISVCFNTSLQKYGGDVAVGAMTILSSAMMASMMPLAGLCQGMQPIVSFNYGAKNMERVRKAFLLTLASCMVYATALWAVAVIFPKGLAGLFTSDEQLMAYASWAMRVYMGATCLFGVQIACQQTFVALGKSLHSLLLASLRKIILLVPLIYIMPAFFENKVFGVFVAEPVADFLAVCATAVLFLCTAWKMMKKG